MGDDLRLALLHADRRAEIDGELEGRTAGLGKGLGGNDRADPDVHPAEVVITDLGSKRLGAGFVIHGRDATSAQPEKKDRRVGGNAAVSSGGLDREGTKPPVSCSKKLAGQAAFFVGVAFGSKAAFTSSKLSTTRLRITSKASLWAF